MTGRITWCLEHITGAGLYAGASFFRKSLEWFGGRNKMGKVIAVNVFFLDYAFLLAVFLIAVYNALKAPDGDNRNDNRRAMKMAEKDYSLKGLMSRMRARRHASAMKE